MTLGSHSPPQPPVTQEALNPIKSHKRKPTSSGLTVAHSPDDAPRSVTPTDNSTPLYYRGSHAHSRLEGRGSRQSQVLQCLPSLSLFPGHTAFLPMAGTNVLSQDWSPGTPNPSHGDASGRGGETAQVSTQPRGLTGRAQGLLGASAASTE